MQPLSKGLVRRVEALENAARMAAVSKRDQLQEMVIEAWALTCTPEEIDEMEAEAKESGFFVPPADLRRRCQQQLDRISIERFGKNFEALLASLPADPPIPGVRGPGPEST